MQTTTPIFTTTLVADGSSDRSLIPIINLLLNEHCPGPYREPGFVDQIPQGTSSLFERIQYSLERYPCDVLFVHRDAERQSPNQRVKEIQQALASLPMPHPAIEVVPVRMTESWLLVSEQAIRRAAGNPAGREALGLPTVNKIEAVDAKDVLFEAIRRACSLGRQRTQRLKPEAYRHRVAEYLDDLSLLRRVPSFARFEVKVRDYFAGAAAANA